MFTTETRRHGEEEGWFGFRGAGAKSSRNLSEAAGGKAHRKILRIVAPVCLHASVRIRCVVLRNVEQVPVFRRIGRSLPVGIAIRLLLVVAVRVLETGICSRLSASIFVRARAHHNRGGAEHQACLPRALLMQPRYRSPKAHHLHRGLNPRRTTHTTPPRVRFTAFGGHQRSPALAGHKTTVIASGRGTFSPTKRTRRLLGGGHEATMSRLCEGS